MNGITPDILARQLQDWAMHEMKFVPHGKYINEKPPSLQNFKSLCRGQQMMDVWRFIIDNVKSEQTITLVEGNLKVSKTFVANDHVNALKTKALKNEFAAKTRELEEKKRKVEHFKTRMDGLRSDLIIAESALETKRRCENALNHRVQLLEAFNDHANRKRQDVEQNSRLIKMRQTFNCRNLQVRYYNRKGSSDNSDDVIEDECTKHVRQCCEQISTFQALAMKGNFGVCINKLPKTKEKVSALVKTVVDDFSTDQLLDSMVSHCENTRQQLSHQNIVSEKQMKPLSLRKLIQDWQVSHVKTFIDTMKCKNSSAQLRNEFHAARELVYQKLADELGMFEPVHKLARNVLDLEAEFVGWQMKLECLASFVERLNGEVSKYNTLSKSLTEKQLRICQFKDMTEVNQSHISALVKEIKWGLMNLENRQSTIDSYVRAALCDDHTEVRECVDELRSHAQRELSQFKSVSLAELLFNQINSDEKLHLTNMSINTLRPESDSSKIILQILSALGFQKTMAPEEILSQVIEMQQEIEADGDYLAEITNDASMLNGSRLEELYKEAKNVDRNLEAKTVLLQTMLEQSKLSIDECERVETIIREWWDQPGQHVTPWLLRNGHTFKQWKAMWTVAVTKLRQMNNQ
ncbi:HAUS augmin-like complex subunit 5 [Tubulanus polymorphus]|uniref:HAUS augmin-like complex subunit 5 n=1 Tax=Tubulanus polymorphus TaxID=672921 RepID=UPI003DA21919